MYKVKGFPKNYQKGYTKCLNREQKCTYMITVVNLATITTIIYVTTITTVTTVITVTSVTIDSTLTDVFELKSFLLH